MDAQTLKDILDKHLKWLRDEDGGERANLSWADLSGANLYEAAIQAGIRTATIYFIEEGAI